MDSTIPAVTPPDDNDLQVKVDTLSIDGTNPEVGDQVEVKVKGSVTKVLNGTAFVKPEMVNDMPVEDNMPDEAETPADNLGSMAANADASGSYGY